MVHGLAFLQRFPVYRRLNLSHSRSHTDACKVPTAHQEEFRVQRLARGHFNPAACQTSNLPITIEITGL